MPPKKDFQEINEYYSTLFHEMVHSTGNKDRLDREGVTGKTASEVKITVKRN
ncbi:zincin-like metallopeptidase domain-containing protein [Gracilibacillus phocaeensis]|uniref:zincin-like metallopeptidase domain-containing protein n=1 Tax=Gracilibacillus phocaeensis TaxID=2042304 RepID=UPI0025704C55|nr:zincin-like metallopeptidase domain-containing protein [Gracilibacillus phocaeensis]